MGFSRPGYWSGQPIPSLGNLPNPGIEPRSPTLQADSLPAEPQGKPKNTGVGISIPSPADLPNPGIKLGSPALQADSLPTELSGKSLKSKYTIQFSSVPQSCPILCNPMDCRTPGFPVLHVSQSWFKFMSIESVMPSSHLILYHPLLLLLSIFPSIGVFSNESALHMRWPE